ncbi:MAG: hypothetical protein DRN14_06845 [Thermoplasmata archaeon]|nr:MAG: hypothetical protein DRN14_06845 [Thermoplasmata archaeon]
MGYSKAIDENSIAETVWDHPKRAYGDLKVKASDNARITTTIEQEYDTETTLCTYTMKVSGEIKIKVIFKRVSDSGEACMRIYKNGSQIAAWCITSEEYVTKSKTTSVQNGDTIEVQGTTNLGATGKCKEVQLCFDADYKWAEVET